MNLFSNLFYRNPILPLIFCAVGVVFVLVLVVFGIVIFRLLAVGLPDAKKAAESYKQFRENKHEKKVKTALGAYKEPVTVPAAPTQTADVFGLSLAPACVASGIPAWQEYYGKPEDWE
jgi:hypothetical protein